MEAIIGSVMRHMLVEVMQMMLSHPTHSQLYIPQPCGVQ